MVRRLYCLLFPGLLVSSSRMPVNLDRGELSPQGATAHHLTPLDSSLGLFGATGNPVVLGNTTVIQLRETIVLSG